MTKLTHEEIDAMEAGQKMNTLVAKLVMEWELCVHQMNKGWDTGVHFDHNKNQPTIKIFHGDWKPSSDIATAFQALETFDRVEWDIEIISDTQDEGKIWGVSLNKYTEEPIGIIAMGSAGSVSLPHALSKAMWKAVTDG